jgi:hypothetical protein
MEIYYSIFDWIGGATTTALKRIGLWVKPCETLRARQTIQDEANLTGEHHVTDHQLFLPA